MFAAAERSRVVHEYVDASVLGQGRLRQPLGIPGVADVTDNRQRFAAGCRNRINRIAGRLPVQVGDNDFRALGREP